jgi:hypothetical protein
MATSLYSASLRLALPTTGDLFGTWGTEINNSITNMVDQAVAGRAVVSMPSDANYTLTALNGTSDEARCAVLRVTSGVSLTAQRNVVVPLVPKLWIIENATTGSQAIQVIAASGTGVVIPNGRTYWVRCDGTNVVVCYGDIVAGLGGAAFPSYAFTGDPNTGMYSPGADQLAWATGGTKRFEVDSSGRFGFGSVPAVTVLKYTVGTLSSTSVSEYGDYTVVSANNTSGAVSKTAVVGVARGVTGYAGTGALVGVSGTADLANAVSASTMYGIQGVVGTGAAGTLITGAAFSTAVSNGSGATITNLINYLSTDISAGAATLIAGYYGNVTTGTGKWNLYVPGSARSYHAGRFLVGTGTENTSGAKLQTSDGITFPATQVASADANTLDDYEEGTFTPTVLGSSTAGTVGYLSQQGRYVKIGGVVYIDMSVYWNSHTGTGQLQVGGLPFAASSSVVASVLSGWNLGVTMSANTTFLPGGISGGATVFGLRELALAGGGPTGIAVCSSGLVVISGVYRVD